MARSIWMARKFNRGMTYQWKAKDLTNAQEDLYGVANVVICCYNEWLLKCHGSCGIGVPEQKWDILKTRKMLRLQVLGPPRLAPYQPMSLRFVGNLILVGRASFMWVLVAQHQSHQNHWLPQVMMHEIEDNSFDPSISCGREDGCRSKQSWLYQESDNLQLQSAVCGGRGVWNYKYQWINWFEHIEKFVYTTKLDNGTELSWSCSIIWLTSCTMCLPYPSSTQWVLCRGGKPYTLRWLLLSVISPWSAWTVIPPLLTNMVHQMLLSSGYNWTSDAVAYNRSRLHFPWGSENVCWNITKSSQKVLLDLNVVLTYLVLLGHFGVILPSLRC
jgi:hypothetical protein